MRPLRLLALMAPLTACPPPDDSDTDTDTGSPELIALDLEPVGQEIPYGSKLWQGPDGIYMHWDGGIWRSADGGQSWAEHVPGLLRPAWLGDGSMFAMKRNEDYGLTGSYDVVRIEADGSQTVLPAPWAVGDPTEVDLIGSGDALWVQVGQRLDEATLGPARLWRLLPGESEWTAISPPAEVFLWGMEADGSGGLWLSDISSTEGPWRVYRTEDGVAWTELWSSDGGSPAVRHISTGTWFMNTRDTDGDTLWRSTDDGESWVALHLSPTRTQIAQAPGGRVVRLEPGAGAAKVEVSSDDGLTWSALDGEMTGATLSSWVPLDDGVLAVESGFLVHRPDTELGWRLVALPHGPGHNYYDIEFVGDIGLAALFDDNPPTGARQTRILQSSDAGATWRPSTQTSMPPGNAICGGEDGWFVAGRTNTLGPENALGFPWAILDAEGLVVLDSGNESAVPGYDNRLPDFIPSALSGGEVVDCIWEPPLIKMSVSDLDAIAGVLVTYDRSATNGAWTYEPVPAGYDYVAPAGLDGKGVAGQFGTSAAAGVTPGAFYWAADLDPSVQEERGGVPWPRELYAPVEGGDGFWGWSSGQIAPIGSIIDTTYRTAPAAVSGYPDGEELFGLAADSQGRTWVATARGLYRERR